MRNKAIVPEMFVRSCISYDSDDFILIQNCMVKQINQIFQKEFSTKLKRKKHAPRRHAKAQRTK
jgi:hypothetical protein